MDQKQTVPYREILCLVYFVLMYGLTNGFEKKTKNNNFTAPSFDVYSTSLKMVTFVHETRSV